MHWTVLYINLCINSKTIVLTLVIALVVRGTLVNKKSQIPCPHGEEKDNKYVNSIMSNSDMSSGQN